MFRDEQNYRAVAFCLQDVKSAEQLIEYFPKHIIEPADSILRDGKGFEVFHCYYYSPKIFTGLEIPEDYQKKIRGVGHYRYNIYFLSTKTKHKRIFFVAVPFLRMALEVYPIVRDKNAGRSTRYQMIDLPELVNAVTEDRHMDGALTITRIKYKIDGDSLVDNCVLRGKDIPHSKTLKLMSEPLRNEGGVTLDPEQVRLTLSQPSLKLVLEVDKSSHFKFWLGKKAYNLPGLSAIMSFLQQERLILESASFPPMRSLKDEAVGGEDG